MASFTFEQIIHEIPSFEVTEKYIWVWNADKIPPHLGFSDGKEYFSLTYRGIDDFQTSTMLRKAKRHLTPVLFIKVRMEDNSQDLLNLFESYERAKPGGATCLSPIKDILKATDDVIQLAHLLQFLNENHRLEAVFGLNLSSGYKSLPVYGWQDIVKQIEILDATK